MMSTLAKKAKIKVNGEFKKFNHWFYYVKFPVKSVVT